MESLETIEKSLSTLFSHVSKLKRDLSVKHLGALTEGSDEDSDEDYNGNGDGNDGACEEIVSDIDDHSGIDSGVEGSFSDVQDRSGLSQGERWCAF